MGPGAVAGAYNTESIPTKQEEPLNQRQIVDSTLPSSPKRKARTGIEALPCCKRQAVESVTLLARTGVQDGGSQHARCEQPERLLQDAQATQLPAKGSAGQAPQLNPIAPPADCPVAAPASEEHWSLVERAIRKAKRAARSELSVTKGEWKRHGYAQTNILSVEHVQDTVPRINCQEVSQAEFVERFERPRIPVVITNLQEGWPAQELWTPQRLLERFGDHKFKVGADDEGYAVRLRMKHFLEYLADPEHQQDDSPMYIFDGTFGDRRGSRAMRRDYKLHEWFREDLMRHAGKHRRPPHRWFVMGPARSGSGLHVDPLATAAWNALLQGHKRWVLFPPGTPRHLVLPHLPGLEREAVSWFSRIHPLTQQPEWPTARPIEIVQGPGETVFVPGGWWHCVLNLDLTVAITHNYASSANFPAVWRHTRRARPKMSVRWLTVLRQELPELARIAEGISERQEEVSASSSSSSSSSSNSSSSSSSSSSSTDDEAGTNKPPTRHAVAREAQAPTQVSCQEAGGPRDTQGPFDNIEHQPSLQ